MSNPRGASDTASGVKPLFLLAFAARLKPCPTRNNLTQSGFRMANLAGSVRNDLRTRHALALVLLVFRNFFCGGLFFGRRCLMPGDIFGCGIAACFGFAG
jgi:hypothetical protein